MCAHLVLLANYCYGEHYLLLALVGFSSLALRPSTPFRSEDSQFLSTTTHPSLILTSSSFCFAAMSGFNRSQYEEPTKPSDLPEVPYRLIAKDHLNRLYTTFIDSAANQPIDGGYGSYCASQVAKITHGWVTDGYGLPSPNFCLFHPGFITCAIDRKIL
jgi:hypothetical protein